MKFETKESSPCVIALSVKAEADEVQAEYKKVLNVFMREAVIPGFRKGKVPLNIIKQKFQKEIADECKQACFREFYPKAVKESGIAAVNLQNVTDVLFTPETGFSCTALVEVKPRIQLQPFRTFLEVPQPESEFLLRVDPNEGIGFFEADGGVWKLEAKRNIADYFEKNLKDLIEAGKVVVMK